MIRRAKEEDLNRIGELLYQVNHVHAEIRPDIFVDGKRKYDLEGLKKLQKQEDCYIYVYDDGNAVEGYAICYLRNSDTEAMIPSKTLFVDDLCVDENFRHQGIGEKLMNCVNEQAVAMGCSFLTLNVWEGNEKAKSFYAKQGMKIREYCLEKKLD